MVSSCGFSVISSSLNLQLLLKKELKEESDNYLDNSRRVYLVDVNRGQNVDILEVWRYHLS